MRPSVPGRVAESETARAVVVVAVPALVTLLCLALVACGGSHSHRAAGVSVTAAVGSDRDKDNDHNDDDTRVLGYGQAAGMADRRASVALVRAYFAAGAASDGARGCSLLVPLISESLAEEYGRLPGLRGKTCAAVLSKLFARRHRELAGKSKRLMVVAVRIAGDKGLVVLDFPELAEVRQIGERRVGGAWRLHELFDGIIE